MTHIHHHLMQLIANKIPFKLDYNLTLFKDYDHTHNLIRTYKIPYSERQEFEGFHENIIMYSTGKSIELTNEFNEVLYDLIQHVFDNELTLLYTPDLEKDNGKDVPVFYIKDDNGNLIQDRFKLTKSMLHLVKLLQRIHNHYNPNN